MESDTIVAQATAQGQGAVAMVRLSGGDALEVLRRISAEDAPRPEPRVVQLREIVDPDEGTVLDRALVTFFEGPASYTGEDVVEISCHGGWLTPSIVVEACTRAGARKAEAGQFTKRAYLHGKLDLVQAEAIADLVEARNRAMRDAAAGQMERGLSARISALRERMVRVEALLAHHVDFPEEDDAPVPLEDVAAEARALSVALERMLATAPEGALLREGALVVFAGAPNVGKSSLYNALLGEERAIVTPEAGTTRDALEVSVQMGGFPFRLVDTAGLREDAEHVERLGIEVAEGYLQRADLVLLCVEAGDEVPAAVVRRLGEVSSAPVVLVETKADEVSGDGPEGPARGVRDGGGGGGPDGGARPYGGDGRRSLDAEGGRPVGRVRLSASTGEGLETLRTLLPELVYSSVISAGSEEPVITRQRQSRALTAALKEVRCFVDALEEGVPAEMAATHLREAATDLEELLGLVTVDDVLDVVFREFCIGK